MADSWTIGQQNPSGYLMKSSHKLKSGHLDDDRLLDSDNPMRLLSSEKVKEEDYEVN